MPNSYTLFQLFGKGHFDFVCANSKLVNSSHQIHYQIPPLPSKAKIPANPSILVKSVKNGYVTKLQYLNYKIIKTKITKSCLSSCTPLKFLMCFSSRQSNNQGNSPKFDYRQQSAVQNICRKNPDILPKLNQFLKSKPFTELQNLKRRADNEIKLIYEDMNHTIRRINNKLTDRIKWGFALTLRDEELKKRDHVTERSEGMDFQQEQYTEFLQDLIRRVLHKFKNFSQITQICTIYGRLLLMAQYKKLACSFISTPQHCKGIKLLVKKIQLIEQGLLQLKRGRFFDDQHLFVKINWLFLLKICSFYKANSCFGAALMSKSSRSHKTDSKHSAKTMFTRSLNPREEHMPLYSSIKRFDKGSPKKQLKKSEGRSAPGTHPPRQPIHKILARSLQQWLITKDQQRRRLAKLKKQQRRKSESLKRLNERIRNYNKRHFKTEHIEQPPWGIDQQRLKRYAERVIEIATRNPEDLTGPFRNIDNEYFVGKAHKKEEEKRKRKSKSKGKKDYYD